MFSCEFYKVFKNTLFVEHHQVTTIHAAFQKTFANVFFFSICCIISIILENPEFNIFQSSITSIVKLTENRTVEQTNFQKGGINVTKKGACKLDLVSDLLLTSSWLVAKKVFEFSKCYIVYFSTFSYFVHYLHENNGNDHFLF